jgi:hypothetical protein
MHPIAYPYPLEAKRRKEIERHSMDIANKYFTNKGYKVTDKSSTQSYDFLISKDGKRDEYVEVKGTSQPLHSIILTRNEFDLALSQGKTHLFIVYDIV